MDCKKMLRIFESCAKPHFQHPISTQELIANEAQKYNCILLSNAIYDRCQSSASSNNTVALAPVINLPAHIVSDYDEK